MTTARVAYTSTGNHPTIQKLNTYFQAARQLRGAASELAQVLAAYSGDTTALQTDTGIPSGSGQAVIDQVARSNAELNGVLLVDELAGSTSYTKTLADRMG